MMETVDHGIMQSNWNKAFLARGFFEVILTDGGSEFTDREAMKRERLEITARRFIIVIRMLSGRKDAARKIMNTFAMCYQINDLIRRVNAGKGDLINQPHQQYKKRQPEQA